MAKAAEKNTKIRIFDDLYSGESLMDESEALEDLENLSLYGDEYFVDLNTDTDVSGDTGPTGLKKRKLDKVQQAQHCLKENEELNEYVFATPPSLPSRPDFTCTKCARIYKCQHFMEIHMSTCDGTVTKRRKLPANEEIGPSLESK